MGLELICAECGDDLVCEGYRYCTECLEALGAEADLDCIDTEHRDGLDSRVKKTMIALSDETDIIITVPANDLVEMLEQVRVHFDCMDAEEAEMIGFSTDRANALHKVAGDLVAHLKTALDVTA